jgi:hypothetical protein
MKHRSMPGKDCWSCCSALNLQHQLRVGSCVGWCLRMIGLCLCASMSSCAWVLATPKCLCAIGPRSCACMPSYAWTLGSLGPTATLSSPGHTRPEEISPGILRAVYTKVNLNPALIEDISIGNVLSPGGGVSAAHMAALHTGIPVSTSIATVNRQCLSSLIAVNRIATQISAGQINVGIGV